MRFTVQYIPISKIKTGIINKVSHRLKGLRKAAQDCMHILVVQKCRKAGHYIIVNGNVNYEYLKYHTTKKLVPCLVDESKASSKLSSWIFRLKKRKLPYNIPYLHPNAMSANRLSIITSFLKQEPRFKQLTRSQQIKILWIGIQYKKTTILSMKSKVAALLK